jgi:5-formyltetrahydrofolate cyclo-ligase
MAQDIPAIRKRIKSARLALDEATRDHAAEKIGAALLRLRALQRAECIAVYLPVNGEVDCLKFLDSEKLRKKRIFLPVLAKTRLKFAPLQADSEWVTNRYGILEPVYEHSGLVDARNLDLVIAPLLAFDERCHRIGMGGGYYDRSFAFRKSRKLWRRPLLVGVAYNFQRIEQILPQPWDIALDMVITEQECYGSY